MRVLLHDIPTEGIDVARVASATPLCSGADLEAVVQRATDATSDQALTAGTEPPVTMAAVERAIADVRPSTLDWLTRARAYVEFANQTERYSDVAAYLATREVRRRLGR
ncbi:hypothetical protein [Amycolatopsis palatopharyngis]|uniref:hypothetical protein n=1 Tax=Amycolatopsis palatopharyngis TaxID=187982 RepID=UPI000E22AC11|nr:hypothetical protein [Amycolatopsis palatopharyngis]